MPGVAVRARHRPMGPGGTSRRRYRCTELIAPEHRTERRPTPRVRLAAHAWRARPPTRTTSFAVPAEGYTAAKIHAWGDADRDLEAVRAARDAAGDDMALIYDAEGCLDRASAERMASALGDLGVRWFEAPLPDLDLEGYRRLVRLGGVAIVPAGDAIWDRRLMVEVLRDPPWSAMRFDVTFAGGITSAIRLSRSRRRSGSTSS